MRLGGYDAGVGEGGMEGRKEELSSAGQEALKGVASLDGQMLKPSTV